MTLVVAVVVEVVVNSCSNKQCRKLYHRKQMEL